jgi:hypothetical protein
MGHKGGCWPNQYQEYLLKASLLKGKEAIDAWYEWKSNVDVDQLDMGSHRLLPLLYRNLHTQGVEDPLMAKFKGIYRYTWYKNQMLFHKIAAILNAFHNAGIRTMVLKGAALAVLHYKDYGLRPMDDFDLLVPTEQAPEAIDLLVKLGWTPADKPLEAINETYISVAHATAFEDVYDLQIDLHWHTFSECCYPNADDDFWKDKVEANIHGVSTHALNPTDQLLHVCVHGARWNLVSPLRWIADAMMIMNTSRSEIDWDRLITQAQKRYYILPLKDTMNYLRDLLNAPIPLSILESIKNIRISKKVERIEYWAKNNPVRFTGALPDYFARYLRYSWMVRTTGLSNQSIGFPRYLQHIWGADHLWHVPFYAAFKGFRRIWKTKHKHV